MVTDTYRTRYAQSGYLKYRSQSNWYLFSEYTGTECPNGFCQVETTTTTCCGQNIHYYSIYSTKSAAIEMWAGSTRIDYTYYDPTNCNCTDNNWVGPWKQQYNGEAHNSGNDMPGSSTSKASFTSVSYAPSKWNGSGSPSFSAVSDYPIPSSTRGYYCSENAGASAFNIWTAGTC